MATSWVEVINGALIKLGALTITQIDSVNNSKGGKLGSLRYEMARDVVSRLHPWNCITTEVSTSNLVSPTPAFSYAYYHQLPSDFLRATKVGPGDVDYRIHGKKIATDETELEVTYIRRETDVSIFDPLLLECISTYLAWDLCTALEQNGEIKNALWAEFERLLPQSKSVDGKEEPAGEIEASLWINSRGSDVGVDRSENWA
jgi:hypothetical protein